MPLPGRMPTKNATNKVGEYSLMTKFPGYRAREDQTTIDPQTLVAPSKNVVIKTSGRIQSVPGYVLDGAASTTIDSGILAHYDFEPSVGSVRNMRAGFLTSAGNDGKLQYRYVDAAGTVNWVTLMKSLTNVRLSFASYWDSVNLVRNLLFVNGTNSVYNWNGAVGTFASADAGTGYLSTLNATPVTAGGSGYVVGDVLTVSGGTATVKVTAVSGATSGAITSVSISNGGTGYVVGDILLVPTGTGGQVKVTEVSSTGAITNLEIFKNGSGYTATYYSPTGGTGTGAQILVNSIGGQSVTNVTLLTTSTGYSVAAGVATTGGTGSGCTLNIAAVANYSITNQGTDTWAQLGFTQGGGSVTIGDTILSYATIVGNKLVGIGNDPTVPGFAVGTIVSQTPVTVAVSAMTGIPSTFNPTVIGCGRNNQAYLGSSSDNTLYLSKVNDYTNYSFTAAARVAGEGWSKTLDAPPTAFVSLENRTDANAYDLYISEGKNYWGIITSSLAIAYDSTGVAKNSIETLQYQRIKAAPLQGAQSERLVGKMKNHIVFVGFDNVANFLGWISYQFVPETVDFSYPIIDDMNSYDFTDASILYHRNYIYLAIPKHGIIRVYNMTDQTKQTTLSVYHPYEDVDVAQQPWFWEAPITYPLSGFYVVDGEIYGHSYTTSESYKLFTGGSLNGQNIECNATFAYDTKGDRTQSKGSNEIWVEGYIAQNTTLTATVTGDMGTFGTSQTRTIDGSDSSIVSYGSGAHSLGTNSLGTEPLGGYKITASTLPAWFHVSLTYPQVSCYLEQISFDSNGVDLSWQLVAFGTNATMTAEGNNQITQ